MKHAQISLLSRNSGHSDIAFPFIPDAYTGGYGIVTVGSHRGCRILLDKRMQTGGSKWGVKYSRFVQFQCSPTCHHPRAAWALLPENEYVSIALVVIERKAAA